MYAGTNKINVYKNDTAGWYSKTDNYYRIGLNGKSYLAHRIIWMLFNGTLEENDYLDHIDGNRYNNTINNLRKVSKEFNSRNQKKHSSNTSGVTGVSYLYTPDGRLYWRARWLFNSIEKTKCFSASKYGYDEAFRLACEWREKMILELNAQGAGYTERHGK